MGTGRWCSLQAIRAINDVTIERSCSMQRLVILSFLMVISACPEGQTIVRNIEALCGNGVVDDLEACDDGNREAGDACTNDCQVAVCGD